MKVSGLNAPPPPPPPRSNPPPPPPIAVKEEKILFDPSFPLEPLLADGAIAAPPAPTVIGYEVPEVTLVDPESNPPAPPPPPP